MNIIKRQTLLLVAASAGLLGSLQASFVLSDGVTLFVTASVGVQHNDNLFLDSTNETSATLWDLTPGVAVEWGDGALNSGQLTVSEDFQRYSLDNLNTSLTRVNFMSAYDDGKMKLTATAWYNQANQATRDVKSANILIKRSLARASLIDEVTLTDKSKVRFGATYDKTNYKSVFYRDWRWVEVPVSYFYEVQPKLDLSGGLRYRKNTITGGINSKELFYNVGARGELAPKLTGEVAVGYIDFNPDSGKDQNAFGVDARLSYEATPKTLLTFGGQNQYGYSGLGDAYRNAGISGGFQSNIADDLTLNGQLSFNRYTYTTTAQKDDFTGGVLSATWKYSQLVAVTGSYTYSKNKSNLAGASFTGNIFALSASLRY
jgi:hypothetical protein